MSALTPSDVAPQAETAKSDKANFTSASGGDDLQTALSSLRGFARDVMRGFPEDLGCDGFDLQEYAAKHGLLALKDPRPTASCGETCQCASYYTPEELAEGVDCYVMTPLLTGPDEPSTASISKETAA